MSRVYSGRTRGQLTRRYAPNCGQLCAPSIWPSRTCSMASTGRWCIRWASEVNQIINPSTYDVYVIIWQVFGTTELSDKPIMLPAFVDATHCLPYHLTSTGRAVADRIVNVLGYDCPDITYSPVLYPITSLLLHFMSGKCYIFTLKLNTRESSSIECRSIVPMLSRYVRSYRSSLGKISQKDRKMFICPDVNKIHKVFISKEHVNTC